MREIRVTIDIDLDSGEYNVSFRNLSNPGEDMQYDKISFYLNKVIKNLDNKIDCEGEA